MVASISMGLPQNPEFFENDKLYFSFSPMLYCVKISLTLQWTLCFCTENQIEVLSTAVYIHLMRKVLLSCLRALYLVVSAIPRDLCCSFTFESL